MKHIQFATALFAVILCSPAIAQAASVVSNFQDGQIDGWTFAGDALSFGIQTGGPTGKYLELVDEGLGPTVVAIAPPKFHGSWAAYEHVGSISCDLGIIQIIGNGDINPMGIFIAGPGGSAIAVFDSPVIGEWDHYEVPIEESAWIVNSGSWDALINNVTFLRITAEFSIGYDTVGIDNVVLTDNPYDIEWSTMDGGGVLGSSADIWTSSGTLGQFDASTTIMSGTEFTLDGGFWHCAEDVTRNGVVDHLDFITVVKDFGKCTDCVTDLDGSGTVDVRDAVIVVLNDCK